jgi:hypothetical protein
LPKILQYPTLHSGQNVVPNDGNVVITVRPRLFMKEPGGMHHLVDDYTLLDATIPQGKHLAARCTANLRRILINFQKELWIAMSSIK